MSLSSVYRTIARFFSSIHCLLMYILTGKSLLERTIINRKQPLPRRVQQIKEAISFTSTTNLTDELELRTVNRKKSLVHDQLYTVIHKLELYQSLMKEIEAIRKTAVASDDLKHLELFEKVWKRLVIPKIGNNEPMSMISKNWTRIGFQGPNPLTDFRGMGLLGLQSIEFLSRDSETCLTCVSIKPPNDYSFAIGVINIISWIVYLFEIPSSNGDYDHPLLTHFSIYPCNLNEFFQLFLLVFNEWHQFWISQKANIMQFEQLSKVFRAQMLVECQQCRLMKPGFSKKISKQS